MSARVRISKFKLDYFRSLARNTRLEVQAYLIGRVVSPELTVVCDIKYPKAYHTQKGNEVAWFLDEYNLMKEEAERQGLKVLGDIHSHSEWDAVLSPADYKSGIQEGFRVHGLCSTQGRKTRVRFWVTESALPLDISYV
jgi:proteasome lid subunit RPN8/RPN11